MRTSSPTVGDPFARSAGVWAILSTDKWGRVIAKHPTCGLTYPLDLGCDKTTRCSHYLSLQLESTSASD